MAKKKRLEQTHKPAPVPGGNTFADFIAGPQTKWLYLAVFALITVLLFQEFIFSNRMLFGSDTIPDGIYTRRYYKAFHEQFGGIPRWNPFILGGLPFIDAMHGDTFYPAAWLKFVMPLTRALGWKLILHVFLAGVFMYAFLRTLRLRREAAFLGGLMYLLAPSFVSWLYGGHDAKMYVIALLPLAFAFLESGMRSGRLWHFVLLGATMGLMILSSQIQMTYYAYWAIGLYFLFRLFSPGAPGDGDSFTVRGGLVRAGLFLLAVALAVSFGAVQLIPSYAFSTSQSVRAGEMRTSYDYATSFSMHPEEAAGMLVPSFPGTTTVDGRPMPQRYWGRNDFKLNTEYHGIVPIVLGIMALVCLRGRWRWFWLGLAVLSLVYALGADTPVYRLFYALVPGIKNFRAPSMIIYLFGFAFIALAAIYASALMDGAASGRPDDRRPIYAVIAIVAVGLVVSLWGRGFFTAWAGIFDPSMTAARESYLAANLPYFFRDLWRVILIACIAVMGSWMFMTRRIATAALVVLAGLGIAIDGFAVDRQYITTIDAAPFADNPSIDPVVRAIRGELDASAQPFRILGAFGSRHGNNYYAMFGIEAADGMHNNELMTYERFRGGAQLTNLIKYWVQGGSLNPGGLARNNYLRVAGVRYIVLDDGQGGNQLLENEYALDRAFVVHDFRTASTDEAAAAMVDDASLDPGMTAVVTGDPGIPADPGVTGSRVTGLETLAHGFAVEAELAAPGLVVLTVNNVPYWHAVVDGEAADILTAYGTFVAIPCPAGAHRITLDYDSKPYDTGKTLTLASFALIVLLLAGTGIREYAARRRSAA